MKSIKQIKTNYGVLTDVSKGVNQFFGDDTGRTVSNRTAHGFKNFFNAKSMDDNAAEFIVHGGMVAATKLLNSKKETDRSNGFMLSMALFVFYQAGK
jgi:N-acetylglucosamine kinase-like BadF-type ATPase